MMINYQLNMQAKMRVLPDVYYADYAAACKKGNCWKIICPFFLGGGGGWGVGGSHEWTRNKCNYNHAKGETNIFKLTFNMNGDLCSWTNVLGNLVCNSLSMSPSFFSLGVSWWYCSMISSEWYYNYWLRWMPELEKKKSNFSSFRNSCQLKFD